ncbi:TlpA family protein disulfide reductase [Tamlana haliotis]|uniref:TlpA family protein disulfide reductase n=1 Tax=Pseudotamlana haliotis TaxID=2614804 RepID=A0A6N6MFJ7_9FLAO|nr:TlpA disulfide reductase family protein [Tamlana haliotis]KAB1068159.1 TlpA family protein disulfide reductase [Tamlana haliotis]
MKKVILFLSIISIISCKKEAEVDYAIISGKILNTEISAIRLMSSDYKFNKTIAVDREGTFIDTINYLPGIFHFSEGRNYSDLYLSAGDHIILNYNSKDFKNSLSITGKGNESSNYLTKKENAVANIMGDRKSFYQLQPEDFKAKCKKIEEEVTHIASSYKGLDKAFFNVEKKNIHYNYLYHLNNYESSHSFYTKQPDFKVPESFLAELDGFDYHNEEDYLNSIYYQYLVQSYYKSKSIELANSSSQDFGVSFIKSVKEIPNEIIRDALLSEQIEEIKYSDNMGQYYTLFMETSTNEDDKKALTELYEKVKVLAVGEPSPKFVNYINNAGGTTSLDDLKGKYVYVDVWATWCGPCKAEIPSLKKVEKQYHDKNIEFLSLSIDKIKDHDKWKKMIKDKELGGVQVLADNAWKSQFVQDYQIKGIPHFILLDPNGNIVKYSAPRPSDKKLIELFNSLNI